jgi:acyl dehydratase
VTGVEHTVDERWLRAYAAGVEDLSPPLFNLLADDGIIAHPVFPVCLEWPLIVRGPPGLGLDVAATRAGLHVSHDITWHRPIRPGDVLVTSIAVESLDQRSKGVLASLGFTTGTRDGEPVVDTRQGILYMGATLGEDRARAPRAAAKPPAVAADTLRDVGSFSVGEADAVLYSECSRIWNPIHTDPRAAHAAGLPKPVLHGTATLARAVSTLVAGRLGGDPTAVRSLGCRFTAAVSAGDHVTVAASPPRAAETTNGGEVLDFVARAADGTAVLKGGFVGLRPAD